MKTVSLIAICSLAILCDFGAFAQTQTRNGPSQASGTVVLAQPERVVASANGRMVAYVRGDVLWAQRLAASGSPVGIPIKVTSGMRRDWGYWREFEAFSPDGSRLAFRTGHGGFNNQGELWMASFDSRGRVSTKPLVTAALSSRLQTFMHYAGGGAAWSRDNRRVAFPALDLTRDKHLQVYVVDTETGTVERWNASKHKAMSYDRMCEKEQQLVAEVARLLKEAEETDAAEDGRYGKGVRAAACYSVEVARNSREHNDANVLTLGSKTISSAEMREIVRAWLGTEISEDRHRKRVGKIEAIERQYQQ